MPDLAWNLRTWNESYDWSRGGDEWSDEFGTPHAQWHWSIRPRIVRFLDAPRVLEIAPGFGRWTQFLAPLAAQLDVVDLAPACVDACRRRFAGHTNIRYHVNDGRTLAAIPSASIDFAFTFGSLVHTDADVVSSYLAELRRVLAPQGAAFIHHSNAGHRAWDGPSPHNFDPGVTAELVDVAAQRSGLVTVSQEIMPWGTPADVLLACYTIVAQPGSPFAVPIGRVTNVLAPHEATYAAAMAQVYPASVAVERLGAAPP